MGRRYEGCSFPVGDFPIVHTCGKPVEVKKVGAFVRCPEHAARLPYWPVQDEAAASPGLAS